MEKSDIIKEVKFEYEIGERVSVYTNEEYVDAVITDRMYHGTIKYYQVTGFISPQKEAFLRKEKVYRPSMN